MARMTTDRVKIDPSLVPDGEWQTACSILAASIRLAFADSAKREDYERWKRDRRARDAQQAQTQI